MFAAPQSSKPSFRNLPEHFAFGPNERSIKVCARLISTPFLKALHLTGLAISIALIWYSGESSRWTPAKAPFT